MIVEIYEDKKTRDSTSSFRGTKEKKGKEKAYGSEPPSPPSSLFDHSCSDLDSESKKTNSGFG